MGKVVVEKKRKKKGRPSLLDLQKRTLKEQQQQQQEQLRQQLQKRSNNSANHPNPKTATPTPVRRSTRRNPIPDSVTQEKAPADHDDHEDDDESAGKRRKKKLKLVLRSDKSSLNSLSSNSSGSESNAEEDNVVPGTNKRKINAIGDGSGLGNSEKVEKSISGTNPTKTSQGAHVDSGPSTPLPDKKLLLFILDRLQKKDTYGVFSEPVDPEELPDYHEIIDHPMDFGTVRKKLDSGAYANLEQFEKDVFLICSNAMEYNAPDTIYFRQARSIEELAKKNFENLRQDSDDNEPEPKVVRRGRPPTKNLKKPLGKPSSENVGAEISSDVPVAAGGENNSNRATYDLRKEIYHRDKPGVGDSAGKMLGFRNNNVFATWLNDNNFERNDDFLGSLSKGNSMKHGKKQIVPNESRRHTYRQFQLSTCGFEASVLNTFDRERKLLTPVGLHSEHGYARSLARFSANLGSVAWRVASMRIEKSLQGGVKFGPGWVGENDITPPRPLPSPSAAPLRPFLGLETSSSITASCPPDSKVLELSQNLQGVDPLEKQVPFTNSTLDGHLSYQILESAATPPSTFVNSQSLNALAGKAGAIEGLDIPSGVRKLNSSGNAIQPKPSVLHPQSRMIYPGINGYNGTHGFNLSTQIGKSIGGTTAAGFNFPRSHVVDVGLRSITDFRYKAAAGALNSINSQAANSALPSSGNEVRNNPAPARAPAPQLHSQPSWEGLSHRKPDAASRTHHKPESVPPDLNVRFQSPGSPISSRSESAHPDLALQL